MRIPNKPGNAALKRTFSDKETLHSAFAREIVHGNVVLLLGHESLLRIPSEKEVMEDENLRMLKDCDGSMEQWVQTLLEKYHHGSDIRTRKDFYVNMFEDGSEIPQLESEDMNPEIRSLIMSKAFRVVLTTTFDPLIEEVMAEAWGGKDKVDIKNFGDRERKDIADIDKLVLAGDIKPTLYYLFGKATNEVSNYGNPRFISDDEEYIRMIKDWMVDPPKMLMAYLSNKRILAIGCKFENWLFRFFWRAILEAEKNTDDFKHLLAIRLSSSAADQKLRKIFELYNLKYPEDINAFLRGLNEAIKIQQQNAFAKEREEGGIFLSYCSKDYDRVLDLFYKLRDYGFKVWMDKKELHYGDDYKDSISKAIDHCTVFVPVLSREISTHLPAEDPFDEHAQNYHFYRDFEWTHAALIYTNGLRQEIPSRHPLSIIPFALDDYNPRQNTVPAEVMTAHPLVFGKSEGPYSNAGFMKFIQTLKERIQ